MPDPTAIPDLGRRTLVMGILNVTPDSFSDGGRFDDPLEARAQAARLAEEGADIIDVGAESTRPGHAPIDEATELARLTDAFDALDDLPGLPPLSIDTSKARVAAAALDRGVAIVNDIWGLQRDPEMASVVAQYRVPVIIMHNAEQIIREGDIIKRMSYFFEHSLKLADRAGIDRRSIVLDPGIGFGKTMPQNLVVLRRLRELTSLGFPLLLGTSRKGFIGRILDLPADQRVEGTLATCILGIAAGVDILRVHDVRPHVRAARVADTIVRGLPLPPP